MPGPWEWVIIVVAVLLIFGTKRLPDIAKSIGKSIKEFKKATRNIKDSIDEEPSNTDKDREKKDIQ